jgi:hypothetical protein
MRLRAVRIRSLRRHLLCLSQGPVLIAPSLAESSHQLLLQSIAIERITEIIRFFHIFDHPICRD